MKIPAKISSRSFFLMYLLLAYAKKVMHIDQSLHIDEVLDIQNDDAIKAGRDLAQTEGLLVLVCLRHWASVLSNQSQCYH